MKKRMSVRPCLCEHEHQDREYGEGRRAHNAMHGDERGARRGEVVGWRCTVCGAEKPTGRAA